MRKQIYFNASWFSPEHFHSFIDDIGGLSSKYEFHVELAKLPFVKIHEEIFFFSECFVVPGFMGVKMALAFLVGKLVGLDGSSERSNFSVSIAFEEKTNIFAVEKKFKKQCIILSEKQGS